MHINEYKTPYFNVSYKNPLKTWLKARKYFKMPSIKIHFRFYWKYMYDFPYASYRYLGKILDINAHDIWWKDKYDTPRHERNPIIFISLFRHLAIWVTFRTYYINELGEREDGDMYYWEYMLYYLYYNDDNKGNLLPPLRRSGAWTSNSKIWRFIKKYGTDEDGSKDEYEPMKKVVPTQLISLNKNGLKKLREEIKNENQKNK